MLEKMESVLLAGDTKDKRNTGKTVAKNTQRERFCVAIKFREEKNERVMLSLAAAVAVTI